MIKKYKDWIETWLTSNNPYGKCAEATLSMQKEFPELIRVRGHYYDAIWGEREHWWLKTKDGEIVDPTAAQFPTKGILGDYEEWEEGREEPIGKCMNCGEYCFESKGGSHHACSKRCHRILIRSFN